MKIDSTLRSWILAETPKTYPDPTGERRRMKERWLREIEAADSPSDLLRLLKKDGGDGVPPSLDLEKRR